MSILNDFDSKPVTRFPGADLLRDRSDLGNDYLPGAVESRNVEFLGPEDVGTRRGFAEARTPNAPNGLDVQHMANWVQANWNLLLYYSRSAQVVRRISFNLGDDLEVVTGINAATVNSKISFTGPRALMAFYGADGLGSDQGRIWNSTFTGSANVNKLFQAPMTEGTEFNAVNVSTGTGSVTAGLHNLAIVVRTRNGYDTLTTIGNVTVTAGQQIQATLTPTTVWPDWIGVGAENRIAMTTTAVPNDYQFVPAPQGAGFQTFAISPGTSTPVILNIDVPDEVLSGSTSADIYFDLITQDSGGNGPFNPRFVGQYRKRTVYIADLDDPQSLGKVSTLYFSEPDQPEFITFENGITLPGRVPATCGFTLQGWYYVLGPNWTFAIEDNGNVPVQWPDFQSIDQRVGTLSPHGVDVNTRQNIAWVADTAGLFPFLGSSYPEIPASWRQTPDWKRINWAAPAGTVQVVDNAEDRTVEVIVPLKTEAEPNPQVATHRMVFNYEDGYTWDRIKYSLDPIGPTPQIGSIAIVENQNSRTQDLWVASAATDGKMYRQKKIAAGDTALYDDAGQSIDDNYISQPLPTYFPARARFAGAHLRVTGGGKAQVTFYDADLKPYESRPINLEETNGRQHLRKKFLFSQAMHVGVKSNDVAGAHFKLSRITPYFRQYLAQGR